MLTFSNALLKCSDFASASVNSLEKLAISSSSAAIGVEKFPILEICFSLFSSVFKVLREAESTVKPVLTFCNFSFIAAICL
ncbi:hypothetical protein D1872_338940 [compost metagenome]